MAINLIRNSRVFFTTNLDSNNRVKVGTVGGTNLKGTPFSETNTFEIQVLEGMSFSQGTAQDTVTLNEAGTAPARGQRSFNTALQPADFTFSTYMRPFNDTQLNKITCEERLLWNSFAAPSIATGAIGGAKAAWQESSTTGTLVVTNSDSHQLQAFGLIIVFSDGAYVIDNCALDTATIDFGLDAIAAIQWAGKGTQVRALENFGIDTTIANPVTFIGTDLTDTPTDTADVAKVKNTYGKYIANKLSTLAIQSSIDPANGTNYSVALTGGSITMSNNLTYLTPANLGTVNLPITYFTGTRSITGTVTAYLKTGNDGSGTPQSAKLLKSLLDNSATAIDPDYGITVSLGGSTNTTRVDLKIPAAMLQIPSVNTEQVISCTMNFTAQGYDSGTNKFDISKSNEISIEYKAAA